MVGAAERAFPRPLPARRPISAFSPASQQSRWGASSYRYLVRNSPQEQLKDTQPKERLKDSQEQPKEQLKDTHEQLKDTQEQLKDTQEQLKDTQEQLAAKEHNDRQPSPDTLTRYTVYDRIMIKLP